MLLVSATEAPPADAATLRVTEQVVVPPERTAEGEQVSAAIPGIGVIVNAAVRLVPPADAVRIADVEMVTDPAVAENAALNEPAGTVTDAGAVRAALLLDITTAAPPIGAACVNCAVQVDEAIDASVVGLQVKVDRAGGGVMVTWTDPAVAVNGTDMPARLDALCCTT